VFACPPRFYTNPTAPYIRTQKIRTKILDSSEVHSACSNQSLSDEEKLRSADVESFMLESKITRRSHDP
jgi:hypothetical protein